MKSLELVNDLIWKTQRKYDYVDLKQDKSQIEKELEEINSEFSKLNQIKKDLEVLEIIKNKKVDMTFFVVAIHSSLPIDEQINYYNRVQCNYCKLIDEEFKKLKQWLEEKKHDN